MGDLLGVVLAAFGNRAWGNGPLLGFTLLNGRFWGVLLTTLAFIIGNSYPVWSYPLIAFSYWIFRLKSPHKWWDTWRENEWSAAFGRTLWVIPMVLLSCILEESLRPLAIGILTIPAIPTAYWAAFHFYQWVAKKYERTIEPVSLGELAVGAILRIITV